MYLQKYLELFAFAPTDQPKLDRILFPASAFGTWPYLVEIYFFLPLPIGCSLDPPSPHYLRGVSVREGSTNIS